MEFSEWSLFFMMISTHVIICVGPIIQLLRITENENPIKQPPDATSSSDSDPDFSLSLRPQIYGLRPSRGSIPRTLISPPTITLLAVRRSPPVHHCTESLSYSGNSPLVAQSAGLSLPGM
ncbi:hypothetical protein AVEN_236127-1 [Araneus ventricosus]|uniref:Uncharacterized protein n=1 Tax=Araneus ventricosus TaxID=182803 RepID=A0A4Y2FYA0_ARAVE|nr:hypothetical protein AVEN_236127-1 [Araneus ventricosus]